MIETETKYDRFGCHCPGDMQDHAADCKHVTLKPDGTYRPKIKWIACRCHCPGGAADHEPGCEHYLCACPHAGHSLSGRHEPDCEHYFEKPEGCTCPWTPEHPHHKMSCSINKADRLTIPATRQADGTLRVDWPYSQMRINEGDLDE